MTSDYTCPRRGFVFGSLLDVFFLFQFNECVTRELLFYYVLLYSTSAVVGEHNGENVVVI